MMDTLRHMLRRAAREEDGYSLVEITTALTLLVSILVPLSGSVAYWMTYTHNQHEIEALVHAQRVMEATLHEESYSSDNIWEDNYRWRISKIVLEDRPQVTILVRVYYREQRTPIVELMTQRLLN